MRRASLSVFLLALAGLLLAACDFRREQELDVSHAEPADECPAASTPVITPTNTPPRATVSQTPHETSTPVGGDTGTPIHVTETPWPSATTVLARPEATACLDEPEATTMPTAEPTPEPTAIARPLSEGLLAFTREALDSGQRAPIEHLWIAGIDGSNQAQIADPEGCEGIGEFDLSSTGGHLAFTCAGGDPIPSTPLFIVALHDLGYTLISSTAVGGSAHWSPGGERLAYLEGGDTGLSHIHTVGPDGSDDRDWGEVPSGSLGGWTPDGRVILNGAFGQCPALCTASVLLKFETGERTDLLDVSEVGPFSPDGRYLLATLRLPRTAGNPSNYPHPDFAVVLIDLSNRSRQQLGFQDRDARPGRWIDDQSFLILARKSPYNPYLPVDCQEWVAKAKDVSQPSLVSNECRDGYLSPDGRYVYFVRIRDPGNFPRVGDVYRLDLNDGSETLWMADALTAEIYEPAP